MDTYTLLYLKWKTSKDYRYCCSVAKSCLTLCNPVDGSMPVFLVLRYLLEFAQTQIYSADDAIQPSHSLSSPSPPALNPPSIRVFPMTALCIRWPKYWSFCFNISSSSEYSKLISLRIDWFDLLAVQGTLKNLLQHHISKALICTLASLALSLLYGPTLTSVHDYWKHHDFD